MPKLRIFTLGHTRVYLDDELIKSFDTDKAFALLVYLSVEPAKSHRRGVLGGLLWSDQPEEHALHSLRQALSSLRKVLGEKKESPVTDPPIILAVKDTLGINPDIPVWLDCRFFEGLLDLAYQHYQGANGKGRLNVRRLKQAANLYAGPFLDRFYLNGSPLFDEWAALKRDYLDQRLIEALSLLTEYHLSRGENISALHTLKRVSQLAPWEETACIQIVRLLAQEEKWSAALAHAHKFTQYLTRELGVDPTPDVLDLIKQVRRRSLAVQPAAQSKTIAPIRIPAVDTPFIGREGELDQLADFLADPCCRLITLLGAGGTGKTRLAVQAAGEQAGIFKDGVFFAHLSSAEDPVDFYSLISEAVGFKFFDDRSPQEQLIHYFNRKDLLLVLDNLEQLAADGPTRTEISEFILALLNSSEQIKILASSRVSLGLRAEQVLKVGGLELPSKENPADASRTSSVELFTQTALRTHPQFSLAEEQAEVIRICQMVDGLPLALELSASWVTVQSCREIAREIEADLDYLSTTMLDVPTRHRSMRAVFDHSWRLLSAWEKKTLKGLAVFKGGFSAEAAQRILNAGPELLASLVNKFLLNRVNADWYELHNLVQQYAAEKLAEDERENRAVRQAFAEYYAGFLASRISALKSAGQQQALEDIALERGNWHRAWDLLIEFRNSAEIARCTEAVFHFYNIRSMFAEGVELLQKGSHWLSENKGQEDVHAQVLVYLGALAYRAHGDVLCHASLEKALPILESIPDLPHLAFGLIFWAGVKSRRKEHKAALEAAQRSAGLNRQLGDDWGKGYALYMLGLLQNRKGLYHDAAQNLQESLAAVWQCGDPHRQIGPLNILADNACSEGLYDLARQYYEECLAICRSIQDRYNEALVTVNLGTVFHINGEREQARRLYLESLQICSDIGDLAGQAVALSNLGELASDSGDHGGALPYLQKGLLLSQEQQDDWAQLSCLNSLIYSYLELEDLPSARRHLREALLLCEVLNSPPLSSITLFHLAKMRVKEGDLEGAAELIHTILHCDGLQEDIRQKVRELCAAEKLLLPAGTPKAIEEVLKEALV